MPDTDLTHSGFENAEDALAFIFGGKSRFTLTSAKSNKRFTFKCQLGKTGEAPPFFVNLLTGPNNAWWGGDWNWCGFIKATEDGEPTSCLLAGNKGHPTSDSFKALSWTLAHLNRGNIPSDLTITHDGVCGKCGKDLTVPESVARGLGPVCAGKV